MLSQKIYGFQEDDIRIRQESNRAIAEQWINSTWVLLYAGDTVTDVYQWLHFVWVDPRVDDTASD